MHRIIVPNHLLRTEQQKRISLLWPLEQVDVWIKENAHGRVGYDASQGSFCFEDARDALMFKMRWC